ncbi:MAG: prenyltransferase/squalene oxidase repeat-containing protein [Planctomycetia bacterium]|nr:MAG: prenyltransferase/squalene oxidase repeat-containing protein [Planctomycetia bacterium]
MAIMIQAERLQSAYETARAGLIAEHVASGHWVGRLASSPLSTATAISALVLAEQHGRRVDGNVAVEQVYQGNLSELIVGGLHWLARQQNADGGWGDTDRSFSNISATLAVAAAFHLTGEPARYAGMLERAEQYVQEQGGLGGLRRRYGKDKTFAVPILTNCALAGTVPWSEVSALPFELACVPQSLYRRLRLPVVSYAIPALVAMGLARFHHAAPINPIIRLVRRAAAGPSLRVLERMSPSSGGFLEAVPLTAFVVMGLAGTGQAEHPVVRRGVEFLLATVRADGSWPIDTDLSVWNTVLSLSALRAAGDADLARLQEPFAAEPCLAWLLGCQQRAAHPMTGTPPGGWAWTDRSGGVPDVDDTSGALVALAQWRPAVGPQLRRSIDAAAAAAVRWLLDLQNADGGWPTFCPGWGRLPFDRSACDLTAHAVRGLIAWRRLRARSNAAGQPDGALQADRGSRRCMAEAIHRGLCYLAANQREDGSWLPLWFGSQHDPADENPVYGTARVLLAMAAAGQMRSATARRGLAWLAAAQQAAGGWGGGPIAAERGFPEQQCSVEETAVATTALLAAGPEPSLEGATEQGLSWLVEAVESGRHAAAAPIGFYFAKLWYYEDLYPQIFTVSALGHAVARTVPESPRRFAQSGTPTR